MAQRDHKTRLSSTRADNANSPHSFVRSSERNFKLIAPDTQRETGIGARPVHLAWGGSYPGGGVQGWAGELGHPLSITWIIKHRGRGGGGGGGGYREEGGRGDRGEPGVLTMMDGVGGRWACYGGAQIGFMLEWTNGNNKRCCGRSSPWSGTINSAPDRDHIP